MMKEGDHRIRATYRKNYDRLAKIKKRYDTGNLFTKGRWDFHSLVETRRGLFAACRIDSRLRDLIRRMGKENRLWGAPRIHGELLKLGITVSERTVSPYLPDRLTAPSQTWRTFLANHLGDLAFASTVTSWYAPGDDDVVDAGVFPFRCAPSSRDGPCASNQWAVVDWPLSLQRTSIGWRSAQAHPHQRTCTGLGSGKDPPNCGPLSLAPTRPGEVPLVMKLLLVQSR
jgi:hypothetical protein